jgi:hypothetical protein
MNPASALPLIRNEATRNISRRVVAFEKYI